jgi:hypothetical protein
MIARVMIDRVMIARALAIAAVAGLAVAAAPLSPLWAQPAQQPAQPPAAGAPGQPAQTGTRPERPLYQIEGFRSARFNMTEQEVREAINRDFPTTGNGPRRVGNIDSQPNRVYRTTALIVTVRELMPDAGTAKVEYIIGYQSRKLIQVNVIWGTPADPNAPLEAVQTAATRLQTFFLQENFPADRRWMNLQQQDGLVMFRGRDAEGRTVEVVAQVQPAVQGRRAAHSVRLSYILNPEQPDVYTLRRGDF